AQPARDLMPGFDRSCEDLVITDTKALHGAGQKPVWSADGRELTFIASASGSCHLYRVPAAGGAHVRLVDAAREVIQFTAAKGKFALLISDPLNIADIYDFSPGGELARRTNVNRVLFDGLRLSPPESFDAGGVQGWLLRPPVMDAGRKYPLILSIHG